MRLVFFRTRFGVVSLRVAWVGASGPSSFFCFAIARLFAFTFFCFSFSSFLFIFPILTSALSNISSCPKSALTSVVYRVRLARTRQLRTGRPLWSFGCYPQKHSSGMYTNENKNTNHHPFQQMVGFSRVPQHLDPSAVRDCRCMSTDRRVQSAVSVSGRTNMGGMMIFSVFETSPGYSCIAGTNALL